MLPIPPYYLGNHNDEMGPGLLIVQGGPSPEAQHTTVMVHGKFGGLHIL